MNRSHVKIKKNRPKITSWIIEIGSRWIRVGEANQSLPAYEYPIYQEVVRHGIIQDWRRLARQLKEILFKDLQLNPAQIRLFYTEPVMQTDADRQKLLQLSFRRLQVPQATLMKRPILIANTYRTNQAIILELGADLSCLSVVIEGQLWPGLFTVFPITGSVLTQYLKQQLLDQGYLFLQEYPERFFEDLKQRRCFVASSYTTLSQKSTRRYRETLPDETQIALRQSTFRTPEAFFQPLLLDYDLPGLPQQIFQLIQKAPIDYRRLLSQNIILAGGSSLFPNLAPRLTRELKKFLPPKVEVQVQTHHDPRTVAWLGGAQLGRLEIPSLWFSSEAKD